MNSFSPNSSNVQLSVFMTRILGQNVPGSPPGNMGTFPGGSGDFGVFPGRYFGSVPGSVGGPAGNVPKVPKTTVNRILL